MFTYRDCGCPAAQAPRGKPVLAPTAHAHHDRGCPAAQAPHSRARRTAPTRIVRAPCMPPTAFGTKKLWLLSPLVELLVFGGKPTQLKAQSNTPSVGIISLLFETFRVLASKLENASFIYFRL